MENQKFKFSVYNQSLLVDDLHINRKFIVIKDTDDVIVKYTDLHKYIHSTRDRGSKYICDDGNNRFDYVCKFLNYIIFENQDKYRVTCVTDITVDMVKDFFDDYGKGGRTKGTVDRCIISIMGFLLELIEAHPNTCKMKESDMIIKKIMRTKKGRVVTKRVLTFDVYFSKNKKPIFRDMPDSVFNIFLNFAAEKFPEIFFLIVLSAFAGLRPSEACNATQYNLIITRVNNRFSRVEIDLLAERVIRADMKPVGQIKKERVQKIYPRFLAQFQECYKIHMEYLKTRKFDENYAPMSVNRDGNAYTYKAYLARFKVLVDKIIPILLSSDNEEIVEYGMLINQNKKHFGPHIFRHWFSMRLALIGEDIAGLQFWRGDKNPSSCLVYLADKGDINRQLERVANGMYEFNMDLAKSQIEQQKA